MFVGRVIREIFETSFNVLNWPPKSIIICLIIVYRKNFVFAIRLHLGLFNEMPRVQNVDSLAFLQHSLTIVMMIAGGILLTWFLLLVFQLFNFIPKMAVDFRRKKELIRFQCIRSLGAFVILVKQSRKLSVLNLIMISFVLFLQILFSLLTNSIKTNDGR